MYEYLCVGCVHRVCVRETETTGEKQKHKFTDTSLHRELNNCENYINYVHKRLLAWNLRCYEDC